MAAAAVVGAVVDVFPVLLFLDYALFVICYCHRQIDHSVTNLQLNCLWNEIEINFQTVNKTKNIFI